MAAKFWFVPHRKSEHETETFASLELLQIHKFLRFKKLDFPQNDKMSLRKESKSDLLTVLELHQDFKIRPHSSGTFFCSIDKHYEIITGKDTRLFRATQENTICCCFRKEYENLVVADLNEVPVLIIQNTEFTGYLSKKLSFTISFECGVKVGEITRIDGFLEKPKYEINDAHNDPLFTLSIDSGGYLHRPNYVVGKHGKTAFLQKTEGFYELKIYHLCSMEEKALLLSLILILDLVSEKG